MAGDPLSVLVVEDEALIVQHVKWLLEDEGFALFAAVPSCHAAAARTAQALPDVALIDLGLRDGDGLPLARGLMDRGVGVVLMTAAPDLPPDFAALRKPFLSDELISAVRAAYRSRRCAP